MSEPEMSEEEQELRARLEVAREKRTVLERGRESRLELSRLRDQVEAEERRARLEEALVAAEEKHGELGKHVRIVHATYSDGHVRGSVIVKRPNALIWKRFRDASGKAKDSDYEKLWRGSLVWPDASAVEALIEELPHTQIKLADACAVLAGAGADEIAGK